MLRVRSATNEYRGVIDIGEILARFGHRGYHARGVMLTNATQISTRRQQLERLASLYVKRLEQGNWRKQ